MKRILILLAALAAGIVSVPAHAADIGVVFLHGKWGMSGPKSPIGPLTQALEKAGHIVDAPEMPWSRGRAYDRDIEGALAEIDAAVKRLKGKGAQRIIVGGQSLGANVALIYGTRRDGLAGIVVTAPGHTPELAAIKDVVAADFARARKMVTDGKGDVKDKFIDVNQGRQQQVGATARVYVDWMNPDGAAVIPKSVAALKPGVPLLWVVGAEDAMAKRGEGYAFAKAPAHPKNAYKVIGGGHADAPTGAAQEVVAWLKGL